MTETATSPKSSIRSLTSPRPLHPTVVAASSLNSSNGVSSSSSSSSSSDNMSMPPLFSARLPTPQQATPAPKTPSPNYFAFQNQDGSFLSDGATHQNTAQNWSPPSSTVRSTAAISPSVLPLDHNPDFEAFRRQSQGKPFSLSTFGSQSNIPTFSLRQQNGPFSPNSLPPRDDTKPMIDPGGTPVNSSHAKSDSLDPSFGELSHSPKRLLSPGSLTLPEASRRGSPASFASSDPGHRTSQPDDASSRAPRFQLPLDATPASVGLAKHRAETIPASFSGSQDDELLTTPQHVLTLIQSSSEDLLILDLRVQTQYAASHVHGALSLCIPTTLLKRPSFTVQKLAETFKDGETRARFENWRKSKYIVVYDNNSSQVKDAHTCMNTIKKFRAEGYGGNMYIVKGGFAEFSKRFPTYVEARKKSLGGSASANGLPLDGPKVAPVIGGCPMPGTDRPANPFFGNIRQNMDLIGGVGQIPLQHPKTATSDVEASKFPTWLKKASDERDQGKKVSDKFEAIERREKKRMEDALSTSVAFGVSSKRSDDQDVVQIAGLEKGTKNRYNNIWPFEHSRVKLEGVPTHGCDYFNANHIKASWSHKRYISTQAPIPATFNDFWSVVWQQDIRVIVMLTAEKEGAQVKAHNYWDQQQYGPLRLNFLSESKATLELDRISRHKQRPQSSSRQSVSGISPSLAPVPSPEAKKGSNEQPYVTVRRFTLSHEEHPFERMREVTQLQYSSWPDFGAPAHPAHLLGLVEQCDAVVRVTEKTKADQPERPGARPILVHCSAGCGRTGTFCTVDSVIDMLKRQMISRPTPEQQINSSGNGSAARKHPHDDDEDFFVSQYREVNDDIEGSWVTRDDLDLVEKTVEDFRHQRLSMVQSLRQFVLCYESVMEWLVHSRKGMI